MSGGVDSSVAALLLREQGYELVGLTMRLWDGGSRCCSSEDALDAKRVAAQLGIPHYTVNLKDEFAREVVDYLVSEYLMGRTPNPCVVCNKTIKFRALLEKARELGACFLATGHYARVSFEEGRWVLRKGKDQDKDQSYFLAMLTQESLAGVKFPLGEETKEDVRRTAEESNLKVAHKEESQEVCFIPDGNCGEFVSKRAGVELKRGPVLTITGERVGTHQGLPHFTIGQRKGFGIALGRPQYVIGMNREMNTITVGDEADLWTRKFLAFSPNWLMAPSFETELQAMAKIRHRHDPSEARIVPEGDKVRVEFTSPQRAITAGQLAVFYEGDVVLGSAWIEKCIE